MDITKRFYSLNEGVVVKVIENEAVVVFVKDAMISSLNETGTHIIELLKNSKHPVPFDTLLKSMIEKFDTVPEVAETDLKEFLNELHKSNLILY